MLKVYIASPYTNGNVTENVDRQIKVFAELMCLGFIPYAPLLMHFVHKMYPHTHEEWVEQDFEWVGTCDCVLRLDGESPGADREVRLAESLGKKVFYSIEELKNYCCL